jgi:hypothetical protein
MRSFKRTVIIEVVIPSCVVRIVAALVITVGGCDYVAFDRCDSTAPINVAGAIGSSGLFANGSRHLQVSPVELLDDCCLACAPSIIQEGPSLVPNDLVRSVTGRDGTVPLSRGPDVFKRPPRS